MSKIFPKIYIYIYILNLKERLVIFYDFFIFLIVMCIWKVCLFRNILIVKINAPTKE